MKIFIAILFFVLFVAIQSEIQNLQENVYELSKKIVKLKKGEMIMGEDELENTIIIIQNALRDIGQINMNCETRARASSQKKLNKAFDELYNLKKHLEFLKKRRGDKNGI